MFRIKASIPLLLSFLLISRLHALPNDQKALMYITAASSEYNYKLRETRFEGQVKVDQGTTHLEADRVITKRNAQNKIHEALAFGLLQPVHYWTYPKKGEKMLHAYAKLMRLYPLESRIVLEGDVRLRQGENRFQGQIIVYNIKSQTITVPPTKNSRATFVIEADQLKQTI